MYDNIEKALRQLDRIKYKCSMIEMLSSPEETEKLIGLYGPDNVMVIMDGVFSEDHQEYCRALELFYSERKEDGQENKQV